MNNQPLMTSIIMVIVFILGLFIGHYAFPNNAAEVGSSVPDTITSKSTVGTTTGTRVVQNADGTTSTPKQGTVINTSSLSPSQKTMLKALGVDADTIVVTPTMIACAEAAVGVQRAEEIKNGATPSFSEGIKLVACYK